VRGAHEDPGTLAARRHHGEEVDPLLHRVQGRYRGGDRALVQLGECGQAPRELGSRDLDRGVLELGLERMRSSAGLVSVLTPALARPPRKRLPQCIGR
jgi:hypothetical protein